MACNLAPYFKICHSSFSSCTINSVQVCLFDSDDEDSEGSEGETGDAAASRSEGESFWKRNSVSVAAQGINSLHLLTIRFVLLICK